MLEITSQRVIDHVLSLPDQPMHGTAGANKLAASLQEPIPTEGRSFESLLSQIFGRILPASLNTASPGYMAYIPGGGLMHSAISDLITSTANRFAGVWLAGPGLAAIEELVLQWFRDLIGFPSEGGGVLTSGGSIANLIAIVAARRTKLPTHFWNGILYTSSQTHHSVSKAAMIAGFPPENVREVCCDQYLRMRMDDLSTKVQKDREDGKIPFLVVGNAGTTNTGAVDPLREIADLCDREKMWFHVDAAYGGFFLLTDRGKSILAGIERAHSVTLDPHKGLFVPYGTGCIVVRNLENLRAAFRVEATYLPPEGTYDAADLSPELSRAARGLRIWLPLKMHGAGAFRELLDEKLDLAHDAADRLRKIPHLKLIEPELSLLAFRLCPPKIEDKSLDALNQELLSAINASQRVFLSGTKLQGSFFLRLCILSFRTHQDRVEELLELVEKESKRLIDSIQNSSDLFQPIIPIRGHGRGGRGAYTCGMSSRAPSPSPPPALATHSLNTNATLVDNQSTKTVEVNAMLIDTGPGKKGANFDVVSVETQLTEFTDGTRIQSWTRTEQRVEVIVPRKNAITTEQIALHSPVLKELTKTLETARLLKLDNDDDYTDDDFDEEDEHDLDLDEEDEEDEEHAPRQLAAPPRLEIAPLPTTQWNSPFKTMRVGSTTITVPDISAIHGQLCELVDRAELHRQAARTALHLIEPLAQRAMNLTRKDALQALRDEAQTLIARPLHQAIQAKDTVVEELEHGQRISLRATGAHRVKEKLDQLIAAATETREASLEAERLLKAIEDAAS